MLFENHWWYFVECGDVITDWNIMITMVKVYGQHLYRSYSGKNTRYAINPAINVNRSHFLRMIDEKMYIII